MKDMISVLLKDCLNKVLNEELDYSKYDHSNNHT